MSKFVISQLALGTPDPVNLDNITTFVKFDSTVKEKDGKYQIHFMKSNTSNGPEEIIWKFKDDCDRDKVYDTLITNFATQV